MLAVVRANAAANGNCKWWWWCVAEDVVIAPRRPIPIVLPIVPHIVSPIIDEIIEVVVFNLIVFFFFCVQILRRNVDASTRYQFIFIIKFFIVRTFFFLLKSQMKIITF